MGRSLGSPCRGSAGAAPSQITEAHLEHYNTGRPHRGIDLEIPVPASAATVTTLPVAGRVERVDVLGGLVHEYRRPA
jgi:hypothetical protein